MGQQWFRRGAFFGGAGTQVYSSNLTLSSGGVDVSVSTNSSGTEVPWSGGVQVLTVTSSNTDVVFNLDDPVVGMPMYIVANLATSSGRANLIPTTTDVVYASSDLTTLSTYRSLLLSQGGAGAVLLASSSNTIYVLGRQGITVGATA